VKASLRRPVARLNRGFTLIELLVTMVILSFVIAVMSGAFAQVAHIVRIASEGGNSFQSRWVQTRALHDAIGSLVLPDNADAPFEGDPKSIRCFTTAAPNKPVGTAQVLELRLDTNGNARTTAMLLTTRDMPSGDGFAEFTARVQTPPVPVEWVQWPEPVEFRFIDRAGLEHTTWPPLGKAQDLLPTAVLVRGREREQTLWRSAVFDGATRKEESNNPFGFMGFTQ